jgi:hypothetical protein
MKLKFEKKEIELTELWFEYLYPSLIRFCLKHNISIEWKNNTISIPADLQLQFNEMLEYTMHDLLSECYKEPSQKERSQNSSRYKKVKFRGVVYVLNYRTDIVGKLGYALDYLISQTKNDIVSK